MTIRRRTLRKISLYVVLGVWTYYSPHYRTVVQCLVAVGSLIVAFLVISTVFPYEKPEPQAKDKTIPTQASDDRNPAQHGKDSFPSNMLLLNLTR